MAPLTVVLLAIPGSTQLFPVRRIYCVGRDYLEHIREEGNDERAPSFFFQKPRHALVRDDATIPYPSLTKDFHHEIELVVALKSGGRTIPKERALDHVFGYAIGLDMTRRDLQRAMQEKKHPWEIGKSFDFAAPCGPLHPVASVGHLGEGFIRLAVNGQMKKNSDLKLMIWNVAKQIAKMPSRPRPHAAKAAITSVKATGSIPLARTSCFIV
ncbi:MAG: fumarylacetoacetate hydrolase family protein [Chitinophagales bacterium]|nr:fumarylacetoacetate hydrolase family protein [Hyphomicrobiales bacterium]